MDVTKLIQWFVEQPRRNKFEVVIILFIGFLLYAINTQYLTINTLNNDRIEADNAYYSRLNTLTLSYQEELQKCIEDQLEEKLSEIRLMRKNYEALYSESIKYYQKLNN